MKDNFVIDNNESIITINKEIYSKEILIQATYVKLEELYFLIDVEDDNYIISLRFKDSKNNTKENLEKATLEFFDELIESASYLDQLKRSSKVREKILQAALLGSKEKK
jgi:His-Xaa-Ser system protein HxsD